MVQYPQSILVCPLSRLPEVVATREPERVVSLLDPEFETPDLGPGYAGRHLRLAFHDAHLATAGSFPPSHDHVRELLSFLRAWSRQAPLLVHCRAGIGRSTAAAYVAACLHNPDADPLNIALELRRVAPLARPNETLVAVADDIMGRGGSMSRAVSATGRGLAWIEVDENVPFELPSIFEKRRP